MIGKKRIVREEDCGRREEERRKRRGEGRMDGKRRKRGRMN
jgi:hypothetical protein